MMGNKITARGIAQECGIPIVPGATISLENAKEVKEFIQLCVLWSLSYDS
jgi:acetyl/propionyl-CoA carboxylase alpha subunit